MVVIYVLHALKLKIGYNAFQFQNLFYYAIRP